VAGEFRDVCERVATLGLQCLAIAKGTSPMPEVVDFATASQFPFPVVKDFTFQYRDSLGLPATPLAHLLDESGRVVSAVEPFYRGASLAVECAAVEWSGGDVETVWRAGEYYGSRACSECHPVEYASWRLTPHALATARVPLERQTDPECLGCHATGAGVDGGYEDRNSTSHLRQVGCEACHGPGGGHPSPEADALATAQATCRSCHDDARMIGGSLETMLDLLDHGLASGFTEDETQERKMALVNNELPRPGVAFGEGICVGSMACGACHPSTYETWTRSPHASPEQSSAASAVDLAVARQEAGRLPCPPAGDDAALLGCESCHGPGGTHLNQGWGDGAIAGLGAAHSRECVTIPFCRRCHTRQADPDWSAPDDVHGPMRE